MYKIEKILRKKWKNWHYKNTFLLIIALFLFFYFIESPAIQFFILKIGSLGYLGAFLAGLLFVSIFTVAPASAILFDLGNSLLNPILIASAAAIGSTVGDLIILRFLKNRVFEEIAPLFRFRKRSLIRIIFTSPYFSWIIPIFGAAIIAMPVMPDEVGISMMGISKIRTWQFLLVTFALNIIGIFLVIDLAVTF